jgi:hypothetical protein
MFDYDPGVPLALTQHNDAGTVTFDNGTGGRCLATLFVPDEPGDAAAVISHGGSADGRRFFMQEAWDLARLGVTVLLPVSDFPRHGDPQASELATRRAVIAHRRGLDLLTAVARPRRLYYFGHSGGSVAGGILSAVEPRLTGVVIAGLGDGTVTRVAEAGLPPGAATEHYLRLLRRFEPVAYVAVPGPRRLLFQYGRRDDTVLRSEALALYEAAAGPKEWREYDCGHDTDNAAARADRARLYTTGAV